MRRIQVLRPCRLGLHSRLRSIQSSLGPVTLEKALPLAGEGQINGPCGVGRADPDESLAGEISKFSVRLPMFAVIGVLG